MDHDKVSKLLGIVEKCAAHGTKLASISNAALAELLELNDRLKQEAAKANIQAEVKRAFVPATSINQVPSEDADIKPSVYPGDSATATLADRRV